MPPTWNDGMLEFWNNGQKIDIVPIVPALHHSSIPIPRPLWPDPAFVLGYELDPRRSKDGRNMITGMSCGAQHNLSLVRMESWQTFFRPRHKGKPHLALRGLGPKGRKPNSQFF